MAVLAAKVCGLKINNIFKKIEKIKSVEGRLELIKTLPNQSKIFLDYAHTPDALENAILSLKSIFKKKLQLFLVVEEKEIKVKRKLMGKIAKKYCDKIYVTDDNPRNENPKKIRSHIMKGLKKSMQKKLQIEKKQLFML